MVLERSVAGMLNLDVLVGKEKKAVIKFFVVEQDRKGLVKWWLVWKHQHEFTTRTFLPLQKEKLPLWCHCPPLTSRSQNFDNGKTLDNFSKGTRASQHKGRQSWIPLKRERAQGITLLVGRDASLKTAGQYSVTRFPWWQAEYEKPWLLPRATSWYSARRVNTGCANVTRTCIFSITLWQTCYLSSQTRLWPYDLTVGLSATLFKQDADAACIRRVWLWHGCDCAGLFRVRSERGRSRSQACVTHV